MRIFPSLLHRVVLSAIVALALAVTISAVVPLPANFPLPNYNAIHGGFDASSNPNAPTEVCLAAIFPISGNYNVRFWLLALFLLLSYDSFAIKGGAHLRAENF